MVQGEALGLCQSLIGASKGEGVVMFIIKDREQVLGLHALYEAAKTLPPGKVIEIPAAELTYDKRLVLGTLIRVTGQKFVMHEIGSNIVFERTGETALPPTKNTPATPPTTTTYQTIRHLKRFVYGTELRQIIERD